MLEDGCLKYSAALARTAWSVESKDTLCGKGGLPEMRHWHGKDALAGFGDEAAMAFAVVALEAQQAGVRGLAERGQRFDGSGLCSEITLEVDLVLRLILAIGITDRFRAA